MLFMFKVKYVDSIMMLVRLDLNLIVSLFQHKCEVLGNGLDYNTAVYTLLFYQDEETKEWNLLLSSSLHF